MKQEPQSHGQVKVKVRLEIFPLPACFIGLRASALVGGCKCEMQCQVAHAEFDTCVKMRLRSLISGLDPEGTNSGNSRVNSLRLNILPVEGTILGQKATGPLNRSLCPSRIPVANPAGIRASRPFPNPLENPSPCPLKSPAPSRAGIPSVSPALVPIESPFLVPVETSFRNPAAGPSPGPVLPFRVDSQLLGGANNT
jgi:hypothetical protein